MKLYLFIYLERPVYACEKICNGTSKALDVHMRALKTYVLLLHSSFVLLLYIFLYVYVYRDFDRGWTYS